MKAVSCGKVRSMTTADMSISPRVGGRLDGRLTRRAFRRENTPITAGKGFQAAVKKEPTPTTRIEQETEVSSIFKTRLLQATSPPAISHLLESAARQERSPPAVTAAALQRLALLAAQPRPKAKGEKQKGGQPGLREAFQKAWDQGVSEILGMLESREESVVSHQDPLLPVAMAVSSYSLVGRIPPPDQRQQEKVNDAFIRLAETDSSDSGESASSHMAQPAAGHQVARFTWAAMSNPQWSMTKAQARALLRLCRRFVQQALHAQQAHHVPQQGLTLGDSVEVSEVVKEEEGLVGDLMQGICGQIPSLDYRQCKDIICSVAALRYPIDPGDLSQLLSRLALSLGTPSKPGSITTKTSQALASLVRQFPGRYDAVLQDPAARWLYSRGGTAGERSPTPAGGGMQGVPAAT